MKVKDLSVGLEVAVDGIGVGERAVVLDTTVWSVLRSTLTGPVHFVPEHLDYAVRTGIPVMVESRYRPGEWVPAVVRPNRITMLWSERAAEIEAWSAAEVRAREAHAAERAKSESRCGRLAVVLGALGVVTAFDGDTVRVTDELIAALESLVSKEVAA